MFKTRSEDLPFIVLASLVFFSALGFSLWDFVSFQGMRFSLGPMSLLGLALFVIGIAIRAAGKFTLGRLYSYGLQIKQDHRLVTHGVYRYVRHPITLAAMMYSVGMPLILSSVYGSLLMLPVIPLFLYRIRIEERMLIREFGDEYREYMKKTKRLIPFVF